MAIFNSLTFDGQNSLDNGVFITAESSYDAPERDIEEIEIAGRNGAFLLDKGRWKNIEVTYKAGAFGSNQTEFANKIKNFRNLMASRIGYKRLTDTYNPNEFRLGTFKDAFEVKPESANRHGEFDLIFNCKPQRYLTNGETEITVSSGDTITNPTAYASSPLFRVQGYGNISVNGQNVSIQNKELGPIIIGKAISGASDSVTCEIDTAFLNNGDAFYITGVTLDRWLRVNPNEHVQLYGITAQVVSGNCRTRTEIITRYVGHCYITADPIGSFYYGVADGVGILARFTASYTLDGSTTRTATYDIGLSIAYDGDKTITIEDASGTVPTNFDSGISAWTSNAPNAISTVGTVGNAFLIDFETGDIFISSGGELMSFNQFADLGSDLLTLKPGANEVTYDNTVTLLKITPRWFIL